MFTVRENTSLIDVTNENFALAVVESFGRDIGIKETKGGKYLLQHPVIAMDSILKRIGSAENKRERDNIEASLVASGVDKTTLAGFKQIDEARKAVKSSTDNGRLPVCVLRRLYGDTDDGKWAPVEVAEGDDTYKDMVKAFKRSVGGFSGHVGRDTVTQIVRGLSVIFANAQDSTVTAQDLGFTAEAMETFLAGKPLELAEAIEVEANEIGETPEA